MSDSLSLFLQMTLHAISTETLLIGFQCNAIDSLSFYLSNLTLFTMYDSAEYSNLRRYIICRCKSTENKEYEYEGFFRSNDELSSFLKFSR